MSKAFTIEKIPLHSRPRLKKTEQQIADIIALPIALFLFILFYFMKLLTKILYRCKRWIWRVSLFGMIFMIAASNLTLTIGSPKAEADLSQPYIVRKVPLVVTKEDIVYSVKHGDIVYRIWNNESSMGQATDPTGINVKCAQKGMSNEFGFDPQDNYCFVSFKDSVIKVNAWFDTCLANSSLSDCLETYSGDSQQYISSFLNI